MSYVVHCREGNPKLLTDTEWCATKGITTRSLIYWKANWEKDGLFALCQEQLSSVIYERVIDINRQALLAWPVALQRLIEIATEEKPKSKFVQMQAVLGLYEKIIKPSMDKMSTPGTPEKAYLNNVKKGLNLNPLAIAGLDEMAPPTSLPDGYNDLSIEDGFLGAAEDD